MDVRAAARAWSAEWSTAWERHEPERLDALYDDGAVFHSAPFREPRRGGNGVRDYAAWAFAGEERAEVRFAEPFATSGTRAVVEWWAVVTSAGREETLAGVSLLDFTASGRVAAQRDYWQVDEGRRHRPESWS
jgi:SnoaL-like domain